MNKNYISSTERSFLKKLTVLFFLVIQSISFSQTNIDFETGNLNGWTGNIGANLNSAVSFASCSTAVNPPLNGTNLSMLPLSYFSMMTTAAPNDPYGAFSLTSPLGGTKVIRLGTENTNVNEGGDCSTPKACGGAGPAYCSTICGTPVGSGYIESPAEAVIQTFAVTSANALLTYAWAAVLNDGGHALGEEPYFEAKVYNQSGVEITCFTNRVVQKSGVTSPGWTKSGTKNCQYAGNPVGDPQKDVYYKGWTTVNVLLTSYIGQNVTIRFAVAGCVDGGHFGYAYFDAKTSPAAITTSNASPCTGQTTTLIAPAGIAGPYAWTGPGIVSGAATATVTVNAAGTYTLSVPTGTCTATMTASVTFGGGPSVTASAGSPTICNGGGPVVLTAGGATTYTWSANAGSVTTNTASVSPSTTTIYTVSGSTAGCTGTQTVAVNVTPTPTVTFSGTTSICNGLSTVLTASTTAGTFTWSANAGSVSTNTVSVTPALGTTIYTVSSTNSGCPGTNTVSVTVNPNPTVGITGTLTNCSGTPVVLTATTSAGTYTWSANAGSVSTSTVSVNPAAGTTTYTLTGTSGTCTANTVATVTTTATPTITVNSPSICSGQSVVLTATTAASYSWSTTATTNTISVNPVSTTNYTVTGTNGTCTSSKTATVTVVAQPTVGITGATSHCSGTPMVLTATTTAGTYTWSTGPSTSTISVNPGLGNTTYTLNGSVGTCTANATITVSVTATPTIAVNNPSICNGQTVILTATTTAASNTWNTGPTTNTISVSPVATTTYSVVGDNGAGCTTTATSTVTVAAQPTVGITGATSHCSGTPVVLTATTTAGTYTWSTGPSTSTISVNPGLGNTTYTLNGSVGTCTATSTITISVTATPTISVNSPTICSGASAILTATSTAASNTWSTGPTTNTISVSPGVGTTTYTVTGDNGAGCTTSATSTVTVGPTPTVSISGGSPMCSGNTLVLTANGTAATYTWLPGGANTTTLSISPPTGTNTFTLTGGTGTCTDVATIIIDVSPTPTVTVNSATICSGQTTVLTATSTSGTYTWSANAGSVSTNTASVNPTTTTIYSVGAIVGPCFDVVTSTVTVNATPTLSLPATNYTVCLGNSVGISASGATTYTWTTGSGLSCTVCQNPVSTPTANTTYTVTGTTGSCSSAATVTVDINVNPLPTLTLSPSSTAICSSTSSTISVSGASTYTWSPAGSLSSASNPTVTATPTTTTNYTVTGTDANGCINSNTVSITVAPTPIVSISSLPPVACAGQTVILNGGTATTYTWSANAGSANTSSVSVTPAVNTTYTLTGTTGSCTASAVATVTVNPLPAIQSNTVTAAPCGLSTGCIDSVSVTGGSPGYQYSWDNGLTWSAASQHCGVPASNYTVLVQDINGCKDSQVIAVGNISGPPVPTVAATATAVCIGDTTSLSITAPLGTYTYTWTDATGSHTGTTYTISNINPAGNYNINITATDGSGCVASTSTIITVNTLPVTTVSGVTHFCKGGSGTTLTASPNGAGYNYQWSQGGVVIGGATSGTYNAGGAGTYNVLITDNTTGCKASSAANYTVTLDSLPKIDITSIVINPSNCGGSTGSVTNVTVTPGGATTYTWTDASGAIVGNSINLSGVPAGNYCLHATTSPENCVDSLCSITVTNPNTPPSPVLTTTNNAYCQGVTQNPIVVTGSVTLNWYSDAGLVTQIATGTTYTPSVAVTTTVYVNSTSSGCSGPTLPVVITINPIPTSPLAVNPDSVLCQSQIISPITASAAGNPTILWSTSPTMSPIVNTGTSYTPSGLAPGTTTIYYLQDTTAAGCKSAGTTTISVTINPTPADPTLTSSNAAYCQGQTILPITATGAPTILWYDNAGLTPVINTGTSYTPVGIVPGTTTVYYLVDSASGCKSTGTVTVSITVNPTPADPTVSATGTTVCSGQAIGTFTATSTSGGNILWSTSPTINPVVSAGTTYSPPNTVGTFTYYVQDTSNAGCKSNGIDSIVVTVYPSPAVSGGNLITATCGNLNGGVGSLTVALGTPVYTYTWTDGTGATVGNSLQLSGVGPGNYSLAVTDANGCFATGILPVYIVPAITVPTVTITPALTQGTAPVSVTFTSNVVSTGTPTYVWNFGDGTSSNSPNPTVVTYTAPGTYSVVLTVDNGTCAGTATATVIVDAPVSIIIPNIYSPNGDGINDEFFITCVGIKTLHCDIFNRWGQLVYQLLAPNDSWNGIMNNGNTATDGTYFYILDATGFDGKKYDSKGSLTLVK
jgi:gliding motility-associated-like protein